MDTTQEQPVIKTEHQYVYSKWDSEISTFHVPHKKAFEYKLWQSSYLC